MSVDERDEAAQQIRDYFVRFWFDNEGRAHERCWAMAPGPYPETGARCILPAEHEGGHVVTR